MGLYQKYRPQRLKEFVGNEILKKDLLPFLTGKRTPPKAVLFTGPSGAGKTTLARIYARRIGCSPMDITELDTADFRGIDSIREIRSQMGLATFGGGNRCWILDECFAAGTPVNTPSGKVKIEKMKEGASAYSAVGIDTVRKLRKVKVKLDRVCLVTLWDGRMFLTTREHEFFTRTGWVAVSSMRRAMYKLNHREVCLVASNDTPKVPFFSFLAEGKLWNSLAKACGDVELSSLPRGTADSFPHDKFMVVKSIVPFASVKDKFSGSAGPGKGWERITNKELEQGYIEFYDLEMVKHHSYYVDGILVHNCHKLTNDAQNALLKALESPPEHVFFVLCTTDPQMVLKTILTRCTQFQVESLSASELVEVLDRVCRGEGADIDEDILRQVAKGAGGSPRMAISMLERLLARDPEDYDEVLQSFEGYEVQIRDLCQALLAGRAKWKEIAGMIKGIKEEPETVRRSVLGYMNAILLSGKDSARAAYILDCFKEPYFNTGPAGLTLSCYAGLMQE